MSPFDLGMRGQDLFDQGRAGARQAQDKDGIGVGRAPAAARFEKGAGRGLYLQGRVRFDGFDMKMTVGALQRVAAVIEGPGRGEIAAILVGLAQGETQVVAVNEMRGLRRFLATHDVHFLIRKRIGFQIGQAPVGIAEVRAGQSGAAVGRDRLRHAADRLERMTQP